MAFQAKQRPRDLGICVNTSGRLSPPIHSMIVWFPRRNNSILIIFIIIIMWYQCGHGTCYSIVHLASHEITVWFTCGPTILYSTALLFSVHANNVKLNWTWTDCVSWIKSSFYRNSQCRSNWNSPIHVPSHQLAIRHTVPSIIRRAIDYRWWRGQREETFQFQNILIEASYRP